MRISLAHHRGACAGAVLGAWLAISSSPRAQTQVHVVAKTPGPGIDFTDPQAAIDAAAPGDIVLLKPVGSPSEYFAAPASGAFAIAGKPVHLVGDGVTETQTCGLAAPLRVSSIAAGTSVALVRIQVRPATPAATGELAAVEGRSCDGSLWFQRSGAIEAGPAQRSGFFLDDCHTVAMVRCSSFVDGPVAQPRHAVWSQDTRLSLLGGYFTGAWGEDHPPASQTGPGGDAIRISGSSSFAYPDQANGGRGGNSYPSAPTCVNGGPGGAALRLLGGAAVTGVLWHHSEGGAGGSAPAPCTKGPSGQLYQIDSGSLAVAPILTISTLWSSDVAREGQALSLLTAGFGWPPGRGLLAVASEPDQVPYQGVPICVGPSAQVFDLGPVSLPSAFSVSFTVADLGPGVEGAVLYTQFAIVKPDGQVVLAPPSAIVLLDASL